MKLSEINTKLLVALQEFLGVPIIFTHQQGVKPKGLYGSLQLVTWKERDYHATRVEWEETEQGEWTANPRNEIECTYQLFMYGANGGDVLVRLRNAVHIQNSLFRMLAPALTIHNLSAINSIPELIDESWEQRFQTNLFVRGVSNEAFNVDTIERADVNFNED